MADIAQRFSQNPLLIPAQVIPSQPDSKIECLLNPGVFQYEGRTYLLVRVAERPKPQPGRVRVPIMEEGKLKILDWDSGDPALTTSDPREFKYKGEGYLHFPICASLPATTVSLFRPPNSRRSGVRVFWKLLASKTAE